MNRVLLSGRLIKDPEVKTSGDMTITKFTLAVDRKVKKGEEKKADFINCTCFGNQASFVEKYFHKGDGMNVEGRIQTGSYKNKEGKTVYTTDVILDAVEFPLSNKSNGSKNEKPSDGFVDIAEEIDALPFN